MNFISSSFTLSSLSLLQLSILVSSNPPLSPSPMLLRDRGDAAEIADDAAALIRRVLTPTISNMGAAAKAEEDD